jgi:hypothetical protein
MLKVDLEKKIDTLEVELRQMRLKAIVVAQNALRDNCDEALPYVAELDKALALDITRNGMLSFDIDVPLGLESDYYHGVEIPDFELTYRGEKISVSSINDLDVY